MLNAMLIDPADNGVVAIEPIAKDSPVEYDCGGETRRLTALEDITIYHKLACRDIPQGEPVVKYGQHIGSAVTDIQAGQHVHVHNVESHSTNV